jgi:hypothetical protein
MEHDDDGSWVMRRDRPKKALELTAEDREKLSLLAWRPKSSHALAMRARIVLQRDEGFAKDEGGTETGVTRTTVVK